MSAVQPLVSSLRLLVCALANAYQNMNNAIIHKLKFGLEGNVFVWLWLISRDFLEVLRIPTIIL